MSESLPHFVTKLVGKLKLCTLLQPLSNKLWTSETVLFEFQPLVWLARSILQWLARFDEIFRIGYVNYLRLPI